MDWALCKSGLWKNKEVKVTDMMIDYWGPLLTDIGFSFFVIVGVIALIIVLIQVIKDSKKK